MHLAESRPSHFPEAPISTCSPGQWQTRNVPHGQARQSGAEGPLPASEQTKQQITTLRMPAVRQRCRPSSTQWQSTSTPACHNDVYSNLLPSTQKTSTPFQVSLGGSHKGFLIILRRFELGNCLKHRLHCCEFPYRFDICIK